MKQDIKKLGAGRVATRMRIGLVRGRGLLLPGIGGQAARSVR